MGGTCTLQAREGLAMHGSHHTQASARTRSVLGTRRGGGVQRGQGVLCSQGTRPPHMMKPLELSHLSAASVAFAATS